MILSVIFFWYWCNYYSLCIIAISSIIYCSNHQRISACLVNYQRNRPVRPIVRRYRNRLGCKFDIVTIKRKSSSGCRYITYATTRVACSSYYYYFTGSYCGSIGWICYINFRRGIIVLSLELFNRVILAFVVWNVNVDFEEFEVEVKLVLFCCPKVWLTIIV